MAFKFKRLGANKGIWVDSAEISDNLDDLLPYAQKLYTSEKRYACVSGGRSSTKTSLAGAFTVVKKSFKPNLKGSFILCTRTYATKIETTTYATVKRVIYQKGIEKQFDFLKSKKMIVNLENDVTFVFSGCQNPEALKSMEDVAIWWHDEAEDLPRDTIEIISPTFRGNPIQPDKYIPRIIFTFNPMTPVDPVFEFCKNKHEDTDFAHVNIFDLPLSHQNPLMLKEAEADRLSDIDYFNWKWLGQPHPRLANQPFANIVIDNSIQFTPNLPCFAFLDPSFRGNDTTALTIAQANLTGGMNIIGFAWKLSWYQADERIVDKIRAYNVTQFLYESNGLGDFVADHFGKKFGLVAVGRDNYSNKVKRIHDTAYHVKNLRFATYENIENIEFMNQLKKYNAKVSTSPKFGEYDDAPDSLASVLYHMRG